MTLSASTICGGGGGGAVRGGGRLCLAPGFLPPGAAVVSGIQAGPQGRRRRRCAAALRPEGRPRDNARCPLPGMSGGEAATFADQAAASWSRISASASAGVFQSRVLRGRPFSSSATAARCAGPYPASEVPLGKYWRSSPLVFSLLPRCHGACGSQKKIAQSGGDRDLRVRAHLPALIPGQRPAHRVRQPRDHRGQRVRHRRRVTPGGQRHQHREPGGALHQGADRGLAGSSPEAQ